MAAGAGLLLLGEDMRATQWLGIGLVILACAGSARGSRNDGAVGGAEMAVSSAVDKVTQFFRCRYGALVSVATADRHHD
ncbi:hypothetical protein IFM12276_28130 [Nocardia sputorum]|uniref:EamA domain-containing protein n=1 Tax=Nocardia sputorum TaxID=2984338 RepID=A0ABM8CXS8_9NOCA|nr:hypothetical protein IFM12276_28130 [Nocardia sputorum]